jgi:hypothetical protein
VESETEVARVEYVVGQRVVWEREARGGYGWSQRIPATVVKVGARRIKVAAELTSGGTREHWVTPARLELRGSEA